MCDHGVMCDHGGNDVYVHLVQMLVLLLLLRWRVFWFFWI